MAEYATASGTFTAVVSGADTGLTGTIGVAITEEDGTVITARSTAGITENIAGSGVYSKTLTAPATAGDYLIVWDNGTGDYADPEYLYVTASSPDGDYFSVSEIRERFPAELRDTTKYPDEVIEARRGEVEERLERLCDVAFVPRTATSIVSTDGGSYLSVPHNKPIAVSEATDDGTAVTVDDALLASGSFYLAAGWGLGVSNLTVTYTHGYSEIPAAVKEAAMLWTRELVVKGPVTDRATQIPTEAGGTINLATPGLLGSTTGIPAVDEIIAEYRHPAFVA